MHTRTRAAACTTGTVTGPAPRCLLTQVRDISTNDQWQRELHLSVPVLAALAGGGAEVQLPRPQPRVPADRLEKHLEAALREAGLLDE